ncbi:hypothetical protein D3C86_1940490 [compost metagenome]
MPEMDIPRQHFQRRPSARELSCCSADLPGAEPEPEASAVALIVWVNSLFEVLPNADLD